MGHTKGEWMLPHFVTNNGNDDGCQCSYVLNEQYCGAIATVHFSINKDVENGDNPLKDEAIANAKLICAAPELLEAIKKALSISDLWTYFGSVLEEHKDEAAVLDAMKKEFESVVEKATNN